jgi:hypothetical protein
MESVIENDSRNVIKSDNKSVIESDSYKRQKTIKDNIYTNSQNSDVKKHELQKIVEENFSRVGKMDRQLSYKQCENLFDKYDLNDKILPTLNAMENWKPLLKNNTSVYLTFLNWVKRNGRGRR